MEPSVQGERSAQNESRSRGRGSATGRRRREWSREEVGDVGEDEVIVF